MRIDFVSHSSVIFRHSGVSLLCDPWLEGTAFDDGWALLSPPVLEPEDFANITHIWFSHEHPDHFSPRSLAAIPEDCRPNIHVLYQRSSDRKVVDFCRGLGFGRITELDGEQWLQLAPGFDILCDRWDGGDDSWLLVKTPQHKVLNVNDCLINSEDEAAALHARVGGVDVLLTQFSVSAWDGNEDDLARRRAGANAMMDRAVMHANRFEARYVIPFASFVWCCHEENAYMNSAMVGVGAVAEAIRGRSGAEPIVMYPGDSWRVDEPFDSMSGIARYEADVASIPGREFYRSVPVPLEELEGAASRFCARLRHGISPLRLRLRSVKMNARYRLKWSGDDPWRGWLNAARAVLQMRVRPARIWISDYDACYYFDLLRGLRPGSKAKDRCDIELSSAALSYAFRFLWGGETLQVNGRFRELRPEGRLTLFDYLWVASAMNHDDGAMARPL